MNKNVILLALCQALITTGNILLVTIAALVGQRLSPSEALTTLPVATQMFGLLVATIPASLFMAKVGRRLGFSLGKLNYCLKALKSKGLVKMKNFQKNPNKINYVYVLTPKGVTEKTKLTINFMKSKMKEYDELKAELKRD